MFNKTTKEGKILVLDIETISKYDKINMQKDLIAEIGITAVNLFTGERKLIYNEIVNEGITEEYKDCWTFEKTTLTYEDVKAAKPLDLETIQQILNAYYCTAFNKSFDFSFFNLRGFRINELECLMTVACEYAKIPPTARMIKYRPDIKYKNPNVQEFWDLFMKEFEIGDDEDGYTEQHRAGDDSLHEALICKYLYDKGAFILPVEN